MTVLFIQLAGLALFVTGTLVLGILLRRKPERANAERLSRVGHGLFYLGLVIPQVVGAFSPGLDNYDDLLRHPGLPNLPVLIALHSLLLVVGLYLYLVSFQALGRLGKGLAAFRLTRELAEGAIYQRVRNPLSLGY